MINIIHTKYNQTGDSISSDNMGMREYNADNKTTSIVGKWGTRKGGYSNDADLEKSSVRQLPLWANVQRPGRETNSEP